MLAREYNRHTHLHALLHIIGLKWCSQISTPHHHSTSNGFGIVWPDLVSMAGLSLRRKPKTPSFNIVDFEIWSTLIGLWRSGGWNRFDRGDETTCKTVSIGGMNPLNRFKFKTSSSQSLGPVGLVRKTMVLIRCWFYQGPSSFYPPGLTHPESE